MTTHSLNDAKTHLSSLIDSVQDGNEVTITRYGKPTAKLVAIDTPKKLKLGFRPIKLSSNLLAKTDSETTKLFSGQGRKSGFDSSARGAKRRTKKADP
jgi:prevent-host-death family protein